MRINKTDFMLISYSDPDKWSHHKSTESCIRNGKCETPISNPSYKNISLFILFISLRFFSRQLRHHAHAQQMHAFYTETYHFNHTGINLIVKGTTIPSRNAQECCQLIIISLSDSIKYNFDKPRLSQQQTISIPKTTVFEIYLLVHHTR